MKKKLGEIPLVILLIILTISVSFMMYICPAYNINKYNSFLVDIQPQQANTNIIKETITDYTKELKEKGYSITDYKLDIESLYKDSIKQGVSSKETTKNNIKNNLDIIIAASKITIGNEIYYFINENESNKFIEELNSNIQQEYTKENENIKISNLTSKINIENKINNIKNEKAEMLKKQQEEEEQRKKAEQLRIAAASKKVTSRGGTTSRTEQKVQISGESSKPLETYVYISSQYGMRHGRMHTGVDFAATAGTSVYAWKSGTIVQASWNGSYGNLIVIQHNDGTISRYAHLNKYNCSIGQIVSAGQTIGYVGSTRK